MTRPHRLVAEGGALALECPYDGTDIGALPEWMRPECRPAAGPCAVRAAAALAGPGALWGGPPRPLEAGLLVHVYRDGDAVRLAAADREDPSARHAR